MSTVNADHAATATADRSVTERSVTARTDRERTAECVEFYLLGNFIYCNSSQKIILLLPLICSKHVLQFAKVEHSIRHLPHCLVCPVGRLGFGGGFLLA